MFRALLPALCLIVVVPAAEAPANHEMAREEPVDTVRESWEAEKTALAETNLPAGMDSGMDSAAEPVPEAAVASELGPDQPGPDSPAPESAEPLVFEEAKAALPAMPPPAVPTLTPEELVLVARESVAPVVEELSVRLGSIERMLLDQSRAAHQTAAESTQALLLVTGGLGAAILLGGILAALILARALRRASATLVAALPAGRQLPYGTALLPADARDTDLEVAASPATQRFLGAMEKLEQRIAELEHTAQAEATAAVANPPGNGVPRAPDQPSGPLEFSVSALSRKQYGQADARAEAAPDPAALWLGKGQALLNLGLAQDAVECFDKAAALNPARAGDAYVRRGMALEQLHQMEAAIESYDRALAADHTLTLAYLYKGAACNKLQRYREALDCYDHALRTEQRTAPE